MDCARDKVHLWMGTAQRHDHARSKVQKYENFGVVITPKFSTIFVCFHATGNQKFRHFSTRRRAAKMAEHSLRVYYHPPESSPQLVTHSLLHNKLQYIISAPSCDQSKHPSPSSPDRVSNFAPTESNIYDTLSTGIRPGYNTTSWVSPMVSFPQASPPTPCAHIYSSLYAPHALPISFVSILPPANFWVRSTDHSAPGYAALSIPLSPRPS
jgi:hypothetical protein